MDNMDASLAELGEMLGISRAAVNNRLKRLQDFL